MNIPKSEVPVRQALALLANIRLGWKRLLQLIQPRLQRQIKKVSKHWPMKVNVAQLFYSLLVNKLERFFPERPFRPCLIFMDNTINVQPAAGTTWVGTGLAQQSKYLPWPPRVTQHRQVIPIFVSRHPTWPSQVRLTDLYSKSTA